MSQIAMKPEAQRRVVTTEQLARLLERGITVKLPAVAQPDEAVMDQYEDTDADQLREVAGKTRQITGVDRVGREQVQCIMVDHPEHLYITDGFMATHNTSNIIFLKSTDDSMIETLSKMSGERNVTYRDGKTVTKDMEKMVSAFNVEGKIGYSFSTTKEAVIKPNDLQSLEMGQSIVFRAGDPVIWNRNETVNPMSFMLFKNTIIHPGHNYSLKTIPTLSTAADFDLLLNQPNFYRVVDKRIEQAVAAKRAVETYKSAYEYSDHQMELVDPDVKSAEIMSMVEVAVKRELGEAIEVEGEGDEAAAHAAFLAQQEAEQGAMARYDISDNTEVAEAKAAADAEQERRDRKIYAGNTIARSDLVKGQYVVRSLEDVLMNAYLRSRSEMERDRANFRVNGNGDLCSIDGKVLVKKLDLRDDVDAMMSHARGADSGVYGEGELGEREAHGAIEFTEAFYRFLAEQLSWDSLGQGKFDSEVSRRMAESVEA